MKILVSGATGFLGSNLVSKLLAGGHELHAVVRQTSSVEKMDSKVRHYTLTDDASALLEYMRQEKFDGVIHLATKFLGTHKIDDISELIQTNVSFATTLLDAAVQTNVRWFINTGTVWQHFEDKQYSPANLYAATKQAFEIMVQFYTETSAIRFVTIELADTYGPGDTRPKIFSLWSKIGKTGEKMDMSPGEQLIDMSHIDDVAEGFVRMVTLLGSEVKLTSDLYSICAARKVTLRELALIFEKQSGMKLNIDWGKNPYRTREVLVPYSKGEPIPGWEPKHSLEEGITNLTKS